MAHVGLRALQVIKPFKVKFKLRKSMTNMLRLCLLLVCHTLHSTPVYGNEQTPTVALAMILRNEEDNLRANLPKWQALGMVDAIVCGIDDRTTDRTAFTIVTELPDKPHWIYYYRFSGFGAARSRVLREAWLKFPHMSHLLIADPDWEPGDMPKIKKSDLDFFHDAFTFTIFDRNSHTTRQSQWLVRHRPNISFAYRLHEQLMLPLPPGVARVKTLGWQVHEIEVKGRKSWHSTVDHGHTQSYKRYLFDLELLRQDEKELSDDPHVLYYIGSTSFAALEALTGRGQHEITPEMSALIDDGINAYKRRLEPHHLANPMTHAEQTWASARFLGYAYQFFRFNVDEATHWYTRCIEIDPARADCPVYLAKLQREQGNVAGAWATILPALKQIFPERSFASNFYIQQCSLPLEGALTLVSQFIQDEQSAPKSTAAELLPNFMLGWSLLRTAQRSCTSEKFDLFVIETSEMVATAEAEFRRIAGTMDIGVAQLEAMCFNNSGQHGEEELGMFKKWGLGVCL